MFRHASVSNTYPGQSIRPSVSPSSVRDTLGFPFCQRPWDLTVADMVADMAADMEVHMVADMEVDKVADMVADMFADIVAKRGTQFGKKKKIFWIVSTHKNVKQ